MRTETEKGGSGPPGVSVRAKGVRSGNEADAGLGEGLVFDFLRLGEKGEKKFALLLAELKKNVDFCTPNSAAG